MFEKCRNCGRYSREDLVKDNGHLLVQVPRRSGISMEENSPQGIWNNIAEKMLVDFAESGCPIFSVKQLHCPGVSTKAKDTENCRFTLLQKKKQLGLFFA